jgi:hypothetical protein
LLRHRVLLSFLLLRPDRSPRHQLRHYILLFRVNHVVPELYLLVLLLHLLQTAASIRRVELVKQAELNLLHPLKPLDDNGLPVIYLLQLANLLELLVLLQILIPHLALDRVQLADYLLLRVISEDDRFLLLLSVCKDGKSKEEVLVM